MSKSFARTFGQDLMRGEHVVGGGQAMKGCAAVPGRNSGTTEAVNHDPDFYRNGKGAHPAVPGRGTSGLAPSSAYTPAARKQSASLNGLTHRISTGAYHPEWEATVASTSGTSIFDPVLTELAYQWFCPHGGTVLDPFAGGSVRGIVASHMGRRYVGVDLRAEQVAANQAQAHVAGPRAPQWHVGDSRGIREICAGVQADFLFSCPPYGDLERYSDDPADISTLGFDEFLEAYRHIIAESAALLKPNRFACFVVGDYRDKNGFYRALPARTIEAFEAAGCRFYNDAVLITAVGSLPVRAGRQFRSGRKLGKTHQNILVFVKGDPRKATQACEAVTVQPSTPSLFDEAAE